MPNRLAGETSPYLLQHADNPVDWWPWSPEAFEEARRRDVPVLLSVGYSTCHWCHVMAHESFEDEATAAQMNAGFVNVKVDREERPDVDAVYMAATQALTGQGGWPMTVFLTPDAEPFYAGTYFPPQEMAGMPSFRRLLGSISAAWQGQRGGLLENAEKLTGFIRDLSQPQQEARALPEDAPARAVENITRLFDARRGGFGGAPKFPSPTNLDFLLTQPEGREMALFTLREMGKGGIYDQLGGGFHRYSVDAEWLVPHFEKMLYDNAQLTRTLLRAYQLTGEATFARLARETLAYLEREMRSPEGGFYSAQDADTPTEHGGVEGLTFTWTPEEITTVLGEEAPLALRYFNVTAQGNFRDPHRPEYGTRSVLHTPQTVEEFAQAEDLEPEELRRTLAAAKARLLAARQTRTQPGTDTKVLTSWNGLALAAFADAGRILGEPGYLEIARRNADFIRREMRLPDGTLRHTFKDGRASVEGLLEDHALYALGLVALYQATGELAHLHWARELWGIIRRDFWDDEAGVFWSSGGNAETLLTRQAQAFDSAVLSDNGAAALLAVWMDRYFGGEDAEQIARRVTERYHAELLAAPTGMGGLWQAVAFLDAPHTEVAVIGTPAERAALERELARHFLPFTALAPSEAGGDLPVLEARPGGGQAYVCVNRACQLPTRDPAELGRQLSALGG
ncbi:hypothetical protein SAMN04488058_10440 [Deinococcus reticulitermitis]|uniref:Spermatogenesis-associated protein 20-like TRX domain-containing protein n=1 Tax=Deinococcus reticulitermitis TaxID=856736 RepID=A0A1H6W396_9DEIO|nr:thioredoxin domain-containing protein [Deinococcus reticulitermitis]SEJ11471.1 hypothetical protein SAMN04488058_10440 [Deinococcus reticulitermitis]